VLTLVAVSYATRLEPTTYFESYQHTQQNLPYSDVPAWTQGLITQGTPPRSYIDRFVSLSLSRSGTPLVVKKLRSGKIVGGNVDAAPGAQQPLANALPVLSPLTESPVSSITSSLALLRLRDKRGAAVATEVTPLGDVGVASPSISAPSGDVAPPGFPMAALSEVESMAPSGDSVSVGPLPGAYHADSYTSEFVDTQRTPSVNNDDDDLDSVKDESDNEDNKYWAAIATRRVPCTPVGSWGWENDAAMFLRGHLSEKTR
jgi:hypothetical protein